MTLDVMSSIVFQTSTDYKTNPQQEYPHKPEEQETVFLCTNLKIYYDLVCPKLIPKRIQMQPKVPSALL